MRRARASRVSIVVSGTSRISAISRCDNPCPAWRRSGSAYCAGSRARSSRASRASAAACRSALSPRQDAANRASDFRSIPRSRAAIRASLTATTRSHPRTLAASRISRAFARNVAATSCNKSSISTPRGACAARTAAIHRRLRRQTDSIASTSPCAARACSRASARSATSASLTSSSDACLPRALSSEKRSDA